MDESTRIARAIRAVVGAGMATIRGAATLPVPPAPFDPHSPITMYQQLRAQYDQNGLYDDVAYFYSNQSLYREALVALRNPANRCAEFYAAKLWPGSDLDEALPIITDGSGEKLKEAIHQVWKAGNWAAKKQLFARFLPVYGDQFIEVVGVAPATGAARVYFQLLEPETTTTVEADERGFLTYLRLDIPKIRRVNDEDKPYVLTKLWERDVITDGMLTGRLREWEHDKKEGAEIKDLGQPLRDFPLLTTFGFSFIPVVQVQFRDIGGNRGQGAYTHALGKMTEADRICTRLHRMIFRHSNATWVATNAGNSPQGQGLPPVRVAGLNASSTATGTIEVGDDRVVSMPGLSQLQLMVPNLPYAQLLDVLNAHMMELERDLPELSYFRLRELGGDLSGRAVRMLLTDAVDKVNEARGQATTGLARADAIAITMGQLLKIPGFEGLGKFEDGSLDHTFDLGDVIPTNSLEDSQAEQAEVLAKISKLELGASKREMLLELGYDEQKVDEMLTEAQAEAEAGAEQFLREFSAGRVPIESTNGNGRSN